MKSLCSNCKAPLNLNCACEDCRESFNIERYLCHVCKEINRSVLRSEYLSRAHSEWKADQNDRRGRMGL
jgi:hypothetical protein